MSTSNKLTYLNETKQELKQKINNLGGSIDDNTTFRNYANQLQNVYDNLPKTEYQEGTEINLGVTSKGKLDYDNGVVGIGQCEQSGEPTPSTPIAIQCVTGNQDVVVSGKNLYNDNTETEAYYYNASGEKVASPSTSETYINLEYNLSDTAITISRATIVGGANIRICEYNGTTFIKRTLTNVASETITLDSNTTRVIFSINKSSSAYFTNLMICKGTDTTYEPYITPTSYQLSLGDIELNAIGNYKDELIYDVDEDKVYKNEKIGKFNIDSTSWQYIQVTQGSLFRSAGVGTGIIKKSTCLCTHYICETQQTRTNPCTYINIDNPIIDVIDSRYTDVNDFITWCRTNNVTWYIPLRDATEIPITDTTLINQVKALYNAHSNNGTTIITSNGDLPMIIKVRGLKGE